MFRKLAKMLLYLFSCKNSTSFGCPNLKFHYWNGSNIHLFQMQNVLVTQMLLLMVQTFVTIKMDCVMKNLDVKVNMEGITVRNVMPWGILEYIQIAKVSKPLKSFWWKKKLGNIFKRSSKQAIIIPYFREWFLRKIFFLES